MNEKFKETKLLLISALHIHKRNYKNRRFVSLLNFIPFCCVKCAPVTIPVYEFKKIISRFSFNRNHIFRYPIE